jgi:hypothetical protein
MLMLDKLSHWLMSRKTEAGDQQRIDPSEFARALLLFAEETTLLQYASDRIDINWYPNGFYMIEQGEVAKDLYLILSGHAQAVREHEAGDLEVLNEMGPGDFFGEMGLAMHQRRSAHVVAVDNVTCLVMSMSEAIAFAGRGSSAIITGGAELGDANQSVIDLGQATHRIDVSAFVRNKIAAMSAHRSQYPIQPDMFPHDMLVELMGYEYFVRVLPRQQLEDTLFPNT